MHSPRTAPQSAFFVPSVTHKGMAGSPSQSPTPGGTSITLDWLTGISYLAGLPFCVVAGCRVGTLLPPRPPSRQRGAAGTSRLGPASGRLLGEAQRFQARSVHDGLVAAQRCELGGDAGRKASISRCSG